MNERELFAAYRRHTEPSPAESSALAAQVANGRGGRGGGRARGLGAGLLAAAAAALLAFLLRAPQAPPGFVAGEEDAYAVFGLSLVSQQRWPADGAGLAGEVAPGSDVGWVQAGLREELDRLFGRADGGSTTSTAAQDRRDASRLRGERIEAKRQRLEPCPRALFDLGRAIAQAWAAGAVSPEAGAAIRALITPPALEVCQSIPSLDRGAALERLRALRALPRPTVGDVERALEPIRRVRAGSTQRPGRDELLAEQVRLLVERFPAPEEEPALVLPEPGFIAEPAGADLERLIAEERQPYEVARALAALRARSATEGASFERRWQHLEALEHAGRYAEELEVADHALRELRRPAGQDAAAWLEWAGALDTYGHAVGALGRPERAQAYLDAAVDAFGRAGRADELGTWLLRWRLERARSAAQRPSEPLLQLDVCAAVFAAEGVLSRRAGDCWNRLAGAADLPLAERLYARSYAAHRRSRGWFRQSQALTNWAGRAVERRPARALDLGRAAREIRQRVYGVGGSRSAATVGGESYVLLVQGRREESLARLTEAMLINARIGHENSISFTGHRDSLGATRWSRDLGGGALDTLLRATSPGAVDPRAWSAFLAWQGAGGRSLYHWSWLARARREHLAEAEAYLGQAREAYFTEVECSRPPGFRAPDCERAVRERRRAAEQAAVALERRLPGLMDRRLTALAEPGPVCAAARARGEAVLSFSEYYAGEGRRHLAVLYLDPASCRVYREPDVDLARLEPAIDGQVRARERLEGCLVRGAACAPAVRALRAAGEQVRALVWDPLVKRVRPGAPLAVVPDGALLRVPLGALPHPRGGYLLEHHRLRFLPSVADVLRTPPRLPPGPQGLLVGDTAVPVPTASGPSCAGLGPPPRLVRALKTPVCPFREPVTWPPLGPHELCEVGELWAATGWRRQTAAGGEAQLERVLDLLAGVDVAHLSVHGFATEAADCARRRPDTADPLDPAGLGQPGADPLEAAALVMAPGQGGRFLTAALVADRARVQSMPQLVVLSACFGHAGTAVPLEGPLSLARAFYDAGAGAVVGSVWPATVGETGALMLAFYRALATGLSPSAALARAQAETLPGAGDAAPLLAAFVVLGGP